MRIDEFDNRTVLVVGGGLTGGSVVRFLANRGIAFDLVDDCGVNAELAAQVTTGRVHDTLDVALATTHDIIVLSPGVPRAHPAIVAALAANVQVIGDIELFAGQTTAPIIAVTGSNGKSTVVAWLADALSRLGVRAVACGNIGQPALDSLADDVECYVLELSSYQLESTTSLAPLAATVLNVSDDHLDRYVSLAEYARVKRRVHANASHIIVNADDSATEPDDAVVPARLSRFTLGLDDAAAAPYETHWHRTVIDDAFWLGQNGEPLIAQDSLALPGDHNAANALAVLALLACLEDRLERTLSDEIKMAALRGFRGLPHRTELVGEADGVRWYNDSKGTNVAACIQAIKAMPGPVLLIAGGQAKGADFSPLVPVVLRHVRAVVLIGQDRDMLGDALAGVTDLHFSEMLGDAVRLCRSLARPGDAVLLSPACASFDMFRNFEDRGSQFTASVDEVLAA